jgi:tRNA (guanine37-N1)-methyltransferase
VDAFYVVTPIQAQRAMAERIIGYWAEDGKARNPDRNVALEVVRVVASVEDAIAAERAILGKDPLLVITSAKPQGTTPFSDLRARLPHEDALVLFGTGYGLAASVVERADVVLERITGRSPDGYNHLSVRSAAAIVLDRLRG